MPTNEYLLLVGVGLAFLYLATIALSAIIIALLAWIDDDRNPSYLITARIAEGYWYSRIPPHEEELRIAAGFGSFLLTILIPLIIKALILYYPVPLFIIGIMTLAHLARFTRRLNKKLKAHVENKEIHNV